MRKELEVNEKHPKASARFLTIQGPINCKGCRDNLQRCSNPGPELANAFGVFIHFKLTQFPVI
jgi:hypothetical protein